MAKIRLKRMPKKVQEFVNKRNAYYDSEDARQDFLKSYSQEDVDNYSNFVDRYDRYKYRVKKWNKNEDKYDKYRLYSAQVENDRIPIEEKMNRLFAARQRPGMSNLFLNDIRSLDNQLNNMKDNLFWMKNGVDTEMYDNGEPIPPVFIENPLPSNQRYITRFHTTKRDNLESILEKGLEPRNGGGYMDTLPKDHKGRVSGVYTTSRHPYKVNFYGNDLNTYYPMNENEVTFRMDIPKDVYSDMSRQNHNSEFEWYPDYRRYKSGTGFNRRSSDRLLATVQDGGRTDIFNQRIDPRYITEICEYDADCIPVKEWLSKYGLENR